MKSTSSAPGMMLLAPVPAWTSRDLEAGRREVLVAAIPLGGGELGQRRQRHVNRVAAALGIGDVALHALDRQHAVQRSAPAVLDRVAEPRDDVGSPMMQASMRLAAGLQLLDDGRRAVDGRRLLRPT